MKCFTLLPRYCFAGFVKIISSIYQYKVLQYLNMAGKSKSVIGAGEPEEIKKESRSLTEHGINLKK